MSISTCYVRAVHNSKNPYTQLHNDTIRDDSLSFSALGLLSYVFSHSDQWTILPKQIWKARKEGKNKIYKLFDELQEQGYCARLVYREKNPHGKFGSTQHFGYVFFEVKATQEDIITQQEEFKKFYRDHHFGEHGFREHAIGDTKKNKEQKKTKFERKQTTPPPGPKPPPTSKVAVSIPSHPEHPSFAAMEQNELLLFFLRNRKDLSEADQLACWEMFLSQQGTLQNPKGWLIAAIKGRWWKASREGKNLLFEKNRSLAMEVLLENPDLGDQTELGYAYLDFKITDGYLEFHDPGFRKKLKKFMEKWGRHWKWE